MQHGEKSADPEGLGGELQRLLGGELAAGDGDHRVGRMRAGAERDPDREQD
jgi:hypothetical protein